MSYDVSIGGFDANYTSNLAEFFHDHIGYEETGLQSLNGKTGKLAALILAETFGRIQRTRRDIGDSGMRARYDAKNEWGSVVGATILLGELMAACHANPRKRVYLSC